MTEVGACIFRTKMRMKTLRILLANQSPLVREGIRHILAGSGMEVSVAGDLDSILGQYERENPDVVIFDAGRNEQGYLALQKLLDAIPDAKAVLVLPDDRTHLIKNCYEMGIMAVISIADHAQALLEAISSSHRGDRYFSPHTAQALARAAIQPENPKAILSPKEFLVFTLIADGSSQLEVASTVGITVRTVASLVKSIKSKLDIDYPVDFTKLAIRHGLITSEIKKRQKA
jgi:DNA-binding NarL/FixJ family response regulator